MSYVKSICEGEFDEIIHCRGKMRMWKAGVFFFVLTTECLIWLSKIRF